MAEKTILQLLDYVYSFDTPVEVDFFGDKQKSQIADEDKKFKKTEDYLSAVGNNPSLGNRLEKDIATGVIYSEGEMEKVRNRHRALEQSGDRVFPDTSLVSPSGQRIIMSRRLSDYLGFVTDGYVLSDELENLILKLKSEGILDDQIKKVRESMQDRGAIVLQRGAFEALFDLLDEVAVYDLRKSQFEKRDQEFEEVKTTFERQADHGSSVEALKAAIQIPTPPKATPIENMPFATKLKRQASNANSISSGFVDELRHEVETKELQSAPTEFALPKASAPAHAPKPATIVPPPPKVITPPSVPKPSVHAVPRPAVSNTTPRPVATPALRAYPSIVGRTTAKPSAIASIQTIDDLKKITVDNLRQGQMSAQIDLLRTKIISIANSSRVIPFVAVNAFEQSPLFKTYLAIGGNLIGNQNTDRKNAFHEAVEALHNQGQDGLSMEEFEAIADLRKELEQL